MSIEDKINSITRAEKIGNIVWYLQQLRMKAAALPHNIPGNAHEARVLKEAMQDLDRTLRNHINGWEE